MKKLIPVIACIALAACTATKLLTPTQTDADRGAKTYPGYTLTDLNQGKALFEQNCNKCHGLKNPASRNADKWGQIVPVMVKRANKKAGSEIINDKDQALILHYLVTMSTAPKPAK